MYELTEWSMDGRAALKAAGASLQELFADGLRGMLAAAQAPGNVVRLAGTRSIAIRAEAVDAGRLFVGLVDSMHGVAESLGASIVDVTIDGVLRTDDGFVGWGSAWLGEGGRPLRAIAFAEEPVVAEAERRRFELTAQLRIDVDGD